LEIVEQCVVEVAVTMFIIKGKLMVGNKEKCHILK